MNRKIAELHERINRSASVDAAIYMFPVGESLAWSLLRGAPIELGDMNPPVRRFHPDFGGEPKI